MRCALKERTTTLAALHQQKAAAPKQIEDVKRDIEFIKLKLARMKQRWTPNHFHPETKPHHKGAPDASSKGTKQRPKNGRAP